MNPDTATLELEGLEQVLSERTRLVAFTHCSNLVGQIHNVRAFTDRIRAAGALSCVDGVAYAPHRRVDVRALGADFYFLSLYKVYGPHMAVLFGKRDLLERAASQNHFFVPESAVPSKHEPGNPCYELVAGTTGIIDYLEWLDAHHTSCDGEQRSGQSEDVLERSFGHIAREEALLVAPLLAFLDSHPRFRVIGSAECEPTTRVPTVAFTVDGMRSGEVVAYLDSLEIATRYGHFYAWRAIDRLGLHENEGIVRASLLHYNTPAEVERLVTGLSKCTR